MKIILLIISPILLFALGEINNGLPENTTSGDPVAGQKVFQTTCFACHGLDGKGLIPGIPDFNKTQDRLAQPDSVLFNHVLNGFQSPGAMIPMPPKGGNATLTNQNIIDAIIYIRNKFGNQTDK